MFLPACAFKSLTVAGFESLSSLENYYIAWHALAHSTMENFHSQASSIALLRNAHILLRSLEVHNKIVVRYTV